MIIPAPIIERFGNDPVAKSGENLIYNCPECQKRVGSIDEHGNLWVDTKKLVFHCFRCEWTGSISNKSSKGYTFEQNPNSKVLAQKTAEALGLVVKRNSIKHFNYKIPSLSVRSVPDAMNYLYNRGIDDNQIDYYNMRFSSFLDGKYKNRIVIPNKLIVKPDGTQTTDMFVARKLYNDADDLPKYLNPVGNNKSEVVFNLHNIPKGYPIIITEGVFSSISAGYNAVATYGKAVSDDQIDMILMNKPKYLYVSLDPDAIKFAIELCERIRAKDSQVPVYLVNMPMGEDPNSLGYSKYKECLDNAILFNPLIIKINEILEN